MPAQAIFIAAGAAMAAGFVRQLGYWPDRPIYRPDVLTGSRCDQDGRDAPLHFII